MGPSKPDRRAPKSGPRPRLPRLLPCTCGNFRWVRDVPRWLPGNPFGSESLREVAGTESRRDRPSVHVESNDRPVRGGGLRAAFTTAAIPLRGTPENTFWSRLPQRLPHAVPAICVRRGVRARPAPGAHFFGFLRSLRRRIISAVYAQGVSRTGPPHAHVEARPATLWRDSLGTAGSSLAAAAAQWRDVQGLRRFACAGRAAVQLGPGRRSRWSCAY